MKRLKSLTLVVIFALAMTFSLGCYVINAQPMSKLKGTYELRSYSWTNAKTNESTSYITKYEYVAYLVITGTGEGYYVWKSVDFPATKEAVSLRYEYSQEDSSKVEYVYYKRESDDEKKFGVNGKNLNFSRPVVKLSDNVYTHGESMSFAKLSDVTDLSYVISMLGELSDPEPLPSPGA